MKFLIVDDDPAILKITQKLLQITGHEVECCDNALDAIQTLSDLTFDILITDATMPAYSGFDLIRSVRKRPALNYLTISMLTGRADKSDIEQAITVGAQDYIVKPIEPDLFLEKVEKLVKLHKSKKQQKPLPLKFNGEMLVPIKVLRITDIGLSIESPYPLVKGSIVKIQLDELRNAGLMQNKFKAIFNTEMEKTGNVITELLMLDLNERDQKLLIKVSQKWLTSKAS